MSKFYSYKSKGKDVSCKLCIVHIDMECKVFSISLSLPQWSVVEAENTLSELSLNFWPWRFYVVSNYYQSFRSLCVNTSLKTFN